MEGRLREAALKGSVSSLLDLLHEDPLLLDKVVVSCISETPLHIASMLGHIDFVKVLLNRQPQLASELNSRGSSPLHLASAKGYIEIVRQLLSIDPNICHVRDQDGRTPLHLAAIKGRVQVLIELIRFKPDATLILTDRGETVLHLCVKHSRFEALKLLMESIQKHECLNWKDDDGNTVLHLAVSKRQIEIIRFLLTIGVEVNALNASGFTALDVLSQSPRDLKDMEIEESLKGAGALRNKEMFFPDLDRAPMKIHQAEAAAPPPPPPKKSKLKKQIKKPTNKDWLDKKKNSLMVVASLIATVAFQAGLSPPGGVWQDEFTGDSNGNSTTKPHHVGMSVMAYEHATEYGHFMIFNTISFLASLSIILLLVSGLPLKRRRWMWIKMGIMWIALMDMALTYFVALNNLTPEHVRGVLYKITKISFIVWLGLITLLFIVHVVRMALWSRRTIKAVIKHISRRGATDGSDEDV